MTIKPPTEHELNIITGYARGYTADRIARELGVTGDSVQSTTSRLCRRLGIRGDRQAALVDYAFRHGYLTVYRPCILGPVPPRQLQVLQRAARGPGARATAAQLGIGIWSVKEYRRRLLHAVGARTMAHAVALAWQAGLLGGPLPAPAEKRPRP
ncbi:LuxR C-terminal-related transcriptional regulator [Streptomyces sp. CC219B]|uniref:LuxR C-terminal-related transcriptional regulator n=1 Tax=Streptomyces sp. CC219B TaxID=3044574 RepID=UPI0024A9AF61|nr:LuxR C-terminal-related transcriptional regulator [Streptomyces sp. CC219B]